VSDARETEAQLSPETVQRIRESEELYARAFMSNPVAMSITDVATARFTHINLAFADLVGFNRSEIIGRTSEQMGFWPDRSERERIGAKIARDASSPLVEGTIRTKSGASVRILASFRLLDASPAAAVLSVLVPLP
jgi:PAS domain S-box-containing protein